jgi:hypothetical protein
LTKAVNTASMADAAKQRFASEPVGLGNSTQRKLSVSTILCAYAR